MPRRKSTPKAPKLVKVQSITFAGRRCTLPDPTLNGDSKVDFGEDTFAYVVPERAAQLVQEYPNDVRVV